MPRNYRWKLVNGKLPLYERHLHALQADGVSAPLCSWIRSRLEWTFDNDRVVNRDGVLCLTWSDEDQVDLTDEPTRTLPANPRDAGLLWTVYGDVGVVPSEEPVLAAETLTRDLCNTLGFTVMAAAPEGVEPTEVFVSSDEFGFVPVGQEGPVSAKMRACFDKLWSLSEDDE